MRYILKQKVITYCNSNIIRELYNIVHPRLKVNGLYQHFTTYDSDRIQIALREEFYVES